MVQSNVENIPKSEIDNESDYGLGDFMEGKPLPNADNPSRSLGQDPSPETDAHTSGEDPSSEEDSGATGRDPAEYYDNVIIMADDVGKSLKAKFEEAKKSADDITELSPTETGLLNQMIFQGYVKHTMYLTEGFPVTFRSVSAKSLRKGWKMLTDENGPAQYIDNIQTSMIVAVYLNSYGTGDRGTLHLDHDEYSRAEFESENAIKERFTFVSEEMDSTVLDILQKRILEFLSLLERIGRVKNVVNF